MIELLRIIKPGTTGEHVTLICKSKKDNLCNYILSDKNLKNKYHIENRVPKIFCFPNQIIEQDNIISLVTFPVFYPKHKSEMGTVFTYSWNRKKPIWNKDDCQAYLYKVKFIEVCGEG